MLNNSNLTLLNKLGIFVKKNALSKNQLMELLDYTKNSPYSFATVRSDKGNYSVNQNDRKTKIIEIDNNINEKIKNFFTEC